MIMMNGLSAATNSSDVKYPPNVANSRGLSAAEMEVDKLYEPKQNKKIVRIFTVILYMFSVSLGAILLSLYYVFLWKNPHTQAINRRADNTSTNTMLLEPTLSSDFLALEDQYDPQSPSHMTPAGERLVRDDLRLLEVGVTAFPKASRGVPPVASRLVDGRHTVEEGSYVPGNDANSAGKTNMNAKRFENYRETSAKQTFMKKRSLNSEKMRHSFNHR
eukprot:GFUD01030568.1.p1 GENE.GFUD01030568.1~~GFUD01030568.1.p1  ORF type:complete len:218 (-),score=63.15 GFUD01030568.1:156-809(-)